MYNKLVAKRKKPSTQIKSCPLIDMLDLWVPKLNIYNRLLHNMRVA